MKIALNTFLVFNCFIAVAQQSSFIYIDFSSTKKLNKLSEKVKEVVNSVEDPFVLFLSNDNSPLIINDQNNVDETLDQMFLLRPSSPDFIFEIDTINAKFSNLEIITKLNGINLNSDEKVKLIFFLNALKLEQNYQDKRLIDRLLLTNRLISKEGLNKGVEVVIYLDSNFDESSDFYTDLIINGKIEIQSY